MSFTPWAGCQTGGAHIRLQTAVASDKSPPMTFLAWLVFLASAVLEVGGDALVRMGLRGRGLILIVAGFLALGCYGLVVNTVRWDFARLLGVYVAIFALVSVVFGRFVFRESIPMSTWIGIAIILIGGMVIQFGAPR